MNLILLGPPGAGKGTQAEKIASFFSLTHISTGELFRQEVSKKTSLGMQAKGFMDRGELVPDEIVLAMIQSVISESQNGFLLDGFPRNVEQAKALGTMLGSQNLRIDHVLSLEVPEDVIVERMVSRGRSDDHPDTIKNRLSVYREQTQPVKEFYAEQGLVHEVNGSQKVDTVFDSICQLLPKGGVQ
ncbi:MAG: adenylate kinase [Bdellovibrionales bacterium]|nr:adenylate kinase [Bdellovibrionales bacterium]